ncbi:probable ATP-dependent RNA helicase DHX40 isoform X3 [Zophobas morio]|uniref:probable ATP-dependent RNA helicase DHX40 isoform X3 n=1 Tax=Zophobas morio TaxID=2755281 RepID=UPI0030832225
MRFSKKSKFLLPIYKDVQQLLLHLKNSLSVSIIVGETGSGKSTQIPQLLYEHGFIKTDETIVISQPRRVAAMSLASRVAEEMNSRLGDLVGYSVRFEDCFSSRTKIKYVTDGCLLRDFLRKQFKQYEVVVLDEAHERSLETDILFGLVKEKFSSPSLQKGRREGPLIIVMSATLDVDKFSSFFKSDVYRIPGSLFPVELVYCNLLGGKEFELGPPTYLGHAVDTVLAIHRQQGPGDILLFLTGQAEIEKVCDALYNASEKLDYHFDVSDSSIKGIAIFPLYALLPPEAQRAAFSKMVPGIRKVVVSTNIAATSITIDGIKYVVDSGFVKQNIFDASTGLQSLAVVPISHSEAKQRAGRAGRTSPGKCYRLYRCEEVMNGYFPPTTVPEIQRSSLANVVLFLKHFGVEDVLSFSFIDPPPKKNLIEALKALVVLDALDPETGKLTQYGTKMVHFPMIPEMSKVLLEAAASNCLDEMTTIVGCLSVERIFYSHKNVDIMRTRRDQLYAENKEPLAVVDDATCLLILFERCWSSQRPSQFCKDYGVFYPAVLDARRIKAQLCEIFRTQNKPLSSCRSLPSKGHMILTERASIILRQCFCAGYFGRAGRLVKGRSYLRTMEGRGNVVFVHPNSLFFGRESELDWCVFLKLWVTSKVFIENIVKIEYKWIENLLSRIHLFNEDNLSTSGTFVRKLVESQEKIALMRSSYEASEKVIESINYKRKTSEEDIKLARVKYLKRKKKSTG